MADYYAAVDRSHKERQMRRRNSMPVRRPVAESIPPVEEPAGPIEVTPVAEISAATPEISSRESMHLPPAEDDSARSRSGIA